MRVLREQRRELLNVERVRRDLNSRADPADQIEHRTQLEARGWIAVLSRSDHAVRESINEGVLE